VRMRMHRWKVDSAYSSNAGPALRRKETACSRNEQEKCEEVRALHGRIQGFAAAACTKRPAVSSPHKGPYSACVEEKVECLQHRQSHVEEKVECLQHRQPHLSALARRLFAQTAASVHAMLKTATDSNLPQSNSYDSEPTAPVAWAVL